MSNTNEKAMFTIVVDGNPNEEMAIALRSAIAEIVRRARRGLEAMGCHPDRWDNEHFDGISRDMSYVQNLKRLLDGVELRIKEGGAE